MNRIGRKSWTAGACVLLVLVAAVWRITTLPRGGQAATDSETLPEATSDELSTTTAKNDDSAQAVAEESNAEQSQRDYGDLIRAAAFPDPGSPDDAANEALVARVATYDPAVLIPKDANTILQHEFVSHRQAWYRTNWLKTFQEYGEADPSWAREAADFLEQSALARTTGPMIAPSDRPRLKQMGLDLLKSGCIDPIVDSVLIEVLSSRSPEYKTIKGRLSASFLNSRYPARIALWAGCPFVTAEHVLQIQDDRGQSADGDATSPFDVSDPLEMRVLLEHFVHRYDLHLEPDPPGIKKKSDLLVAMETSSPVAPWLRHMIIAYHGIAGRLDEVIVMETAGHNPTPGTREFEQLRQELKLEPYFEIKLLRARIGMVVINHLVPAWHKVPQNPEAATVMLRLMPEHGIEVAGGHGVTPPQFWLTQALQAQLDYPPAFQAFHRWLRDYDFGQTALQMANECLESRRFDTVIPAMYPLYMDLAAARSQFESGQFSASRNVKRELYSRGEVYLGIESLVEGYRPEPPPGVDLNYLKSHLACAAFFAKDVDVAQQLVTELGPEYNAEVFGDFQLSPREIQREAFSRNENRPFDLNSGGSVLSMVFASDKALVCLNSLGELKNVNVIDGTVSGVVPAGGRFDGFDISADGRHIVAFDGADTVVGELPSPDLTPVQGAGPLIPLGGTAGRRRYFVTVETQPNSEDLTLSLRDFAETVPAMSIGTQFSEISTVAMSADGAILAILGRAFNAASGSHRVQVTVVSLATGHQTHFDSPFVISVDGIAVNADGTAIALWGKDILYNEFAQGIPCTRLAIQEMKSGETLWSQVCGTHIETALFLNGDQRLLSIEDDRVVHVRDCSNGKEVAVYSGHNVAVTSCAYARESSLLATGDEDGMIRIWNVGADVDSYRAQGLLGQMQFRQITAIEVDPLTQDILTSTVPEGIIRWRRSEDYRASEAFPPGQILWDRSGEPVTVSAEAVRGDPRDVVAIETYGIHFRCGVGEDRAPQFRVEAPDYPMAAIFPDGHTVAVSGQIASVWDLDSEKPYRWGLLSGHHGSVSGVHVSGDGQRIATRSVPITRASEVRVWQVPEDRESKAASCEVIFSRDNDRTRFVDAQLSVGGDALLLNLNYEDIEVWSIDPPRLVMTVPGRRAVFSPDGSMIAVAQGNSEIHLYDTESAQRTRTLVISGHDAQNLRWSQDGASICFSAQGAVSCLDIESNSELIPLAPLAHGDAE